MATCRQAKTVLYNHENPDPERANPQRSGSQIRGVRSLLVAQKMHVVFSDPGTGRIYAGIKIHIVLFECVKGHNIILHKLRNPSIGKTDP
jgi:hypothetical protein